MKTTQTITADGRTAALASAERFWLAPWVARRPVEDPLRVRVILMCAYARDVFAGEVAGPYTDAAAERYATAAAQALDAPARPGVSA